MSKVVGVTGVEPVTLRLSSACSNQLSYTPAFALARSGAAGPASLPENALTPCRVSPELACRAVARYERRLVELRRFELPTYSLQSYRSTN